MENIGRHLKEAAAGNHSSQRPVRPSLCPPPPHWAPTISRVAWPLSPVLAQAVNPQGQGEDELIPGPQHSREAQGRLLDSTRGGQATDLQTVLGLNATRDEAREMALFSWDVEGPRHCVCFKSPSRKSKPQ